jgi:hypothetical protein
MIDLSKSQQLFVAYISAMDKKNVPDSFTSFYLKWLRFYLDFCQKYGHIPENSSSLPLFIQKLRSKKQSNSFLQQADCAIKIYYQLAYAQAKRGIPQKVSRVPKNGHTVTHIS